MHYRENEPSLKTALWVCYAVVVSIICMLEFHALNSQDIVINTYHKQILQLRVEAEQQTEEYEAEHHAALVQIGRLQDRVKRC